MNEPKTYQEFKKSLNQEIPNPKWPLALQSLWYAANDNWEASHNIAQDLNTIVGSWIHAHLHRVEGDDFNAGYWYRQANKPFCNLSFNDEVKEIIKTIL